MKKAIFVNICILSAQSITHISSPKASLDFISILPLLAYFIVIMNVKHIFTSRENRIEKRGKISLYVLIILCYSMIVASACAGYFNKDTTAYFLENASHIVWLVLIAVYFNTIFKSEKND